ncbi:winged helix-turn-helix transcriptional regulator [Streptomyces carpaticus]|uniref:Winged helix-turn-helix transcriptional regulator n=1 Tax=Streptomyces carpaticus TaxID=285558 RepID=A0ABV4ZHF6_9ACTN
MAERRDGHDGGGCAEPDDAMTRVFGVFGKRWTGLVVAALMSGPGHFAVLRRSIPGISERMLSDRLSELAALDLVSREVDPGPPLRVMYRLTEAGENLRPALVELSRWAERHLVDGAEKCPKALRE